MNCIGIECNEMTRDETKTKWLGIWDMIKIGRKKSP